MEAIICLTQIGVSCMSDTESQASERTEEPLAAKLAVAICEALQEAVIAEKEFDCSQWDSDGYFVGSSAA